MYKAIQSCAKLAKIFASLSLLLLSVLLVTILVPVLAFKDRLFGNPRTDKALQIYLTRHP
jgi:hypothetical protein